MGGTACFTYDGSGMGLWLCFVNDCGLGRFECWLEGRDDAPEAGDWGPSVQRLSPVWLPVSQEGPASCCRLAGCKGSDPCLKSKDEVPGVSGPARWE